MASEYDDVEADRNELEFNRMRSLESARQTRTQPRSPEFAQKLANRVAREGRLC